MKKTFFRKKKIRRSIRNAVIVFLSILVIVSAYSTYAAYQQPTTTEKKVTTCYYNHKGNFNYVVYLKNNTVYNTSILYPGQATIFRKITDHINAFFTYTFMCDQPANITGHYAVLAQVQTDMWNKELIVIPKTSFASNGNRASFNINFPINYSYFESIIDQINDETGVNAGNPTLIMKCDVIISANTSKGSIYDSFAPSWSVSLGGNIIEIDGDLLQSKHGVIEKTKEVFQPEVIEQRTTWISTSIIFFIILIGFTVFTKSEVKAINKTEKLVKKIKKKYGEWIVEVEKQPMTPRSEIIRMKSLEDLIKISEELGKPVIYYKHSSHRKKQHMFYVFDESVQYEYNT